MIAKDIASLNHREETAVIINVGTKVVTTLALLSAIKYAGMRVLLIDCESQDGSFEHFRSLLTSYDFDLLASPRRRHGQMLDWLFMNIRSGRVLLVDSDVEILDPGFILWMRLFIDDPKVFGSGFIHGPVWMESHSPAGGYYAERMWIPLTLLKTSLVQKALANGCSFMDRIFYNDFPYWQFLGHLLFKRDRFDSLRNSTLSWLNFLKKRIDGLTPSYVQYDTGADIYRFLKYVQGLYFVGYPAHLHETFAKHYHGITRLVLSQTDRNGTALNDVIVEIEKRLLDEYKIRV